MLNPNPTLAYGIAAVSGFTLLQAYSQVAPDLADLRASDPEDGQVRQRLLDANILFGIFAITLGFIIAGLSRDVTPLIIMLSLFLVLALFYNFIRRIPNA